MTPTRQHFQRLARFVAVFGFIAWVVGTLITLFEGSSELFQRFGSIGVAASVLFFTDRLLKIELSRQRSVERLLHEYGIELQAMKSGTNPTDIPSEGYVVDFLTEERNFDKLRNRADNFNAANVGLMTITTLQWGFGDYFLRWLQTFGVPQ